MTKWGSVTSEDTGLAQANRQRFTLSSTSATYPKKEAWEAEAAGDRVRFTSTMCGESFMVKPSSEIDIMDVTKGTCVVTITPGKYSTRHGEKLAVLAGLYSGSQTRTNAGWFPAWSIGAILSTLRQSRPKESRVLWQSASPGRDHHRQAV